MAHGVERNRFVLKILDQRAFQLGIRRALQARVERFDHNLCAVSLTVVRHEDLSVAAQTEPLPNFVAIINQAVFELQLRHKVQLQVAIKMYSKLSSLLRSLLRAPRLHQVLCLTRPSKLESLLYNR